MSKLAEFLVVHILLVVGVLAMSWGPVVYMLRTVAMHGGCVVRLREVHASNLKPGDVVGAWVRRTAPTRPFQEMASALTVESVDFSHNERGIRIGVHVTWRGGFNAAPLGVADKVVVIES